MGIKKGLKAGLAENFKIKIGMKHDKNNTYLDGKKVRRRKTKKLKHFRLCLTSRETPEWKGDKNNFKLAGELHAKECYGPEPTELAVTAPFDDIEMIFPTEYAYWDKGKKLCCGDGVDAKRTMKPDKVELLPCDIETCPYAKSGKCKATGRLHVILSKAPRVGSVAVFRTHGWNSVSNILNSLEAISEQTGGILRGIPMRLTILEKDSMEFGAIIHVNIETVAADWDAVADHRMKELESRHKMNTDVKLIEAKAVIDGVIIDKDDPEDICDEFAPDEKGAFASLPNENMAAQVLGVEPEVEDAVIEPVVEPESTPPAEQKAPAEQKPATEPLPKGECGCGKYAIPGQNKCQTCIDLTAGAKAYEDAQKAKIEAEVRAKIAQEEADKKAAIEAANVVLNTAKPEPKPTTDSKCKDCGATLCNKVEFMSKVCMACVEKRKSGAKPATTREDDASVALEGDSF